MSGEVNGTKVFVAIEDSSTPGTFNMVGGQTSHTLTLNNTPIDITNKGSNSFRELLESEGLQSIDLSLELVFNSDAAYQQMRARAQSKQSDNYQIMIDATEVLVGRFMIATWGETSPDNDKLTNSVSLQSTGAFTFA